MKRFLSSHTPLTTLIALAIILFGVLPGATRAGAADLPHIFLHAGGGTQPITVVDRNQFLVDATGFQSGETIKIQATFPTYDGNTIVQNRTATANGQGNIVNVTMFAPAGVKAGWSNLTANGQQSNKQAQGRVWVAYRPYIFLNTKTITPGASFTVNGRAFVANSQMRVQITIQSGGGNTQTLTVTATTANNGNFSASIRTPGYTSSGTYTVTAIDTTGGFKRYAKLTVSQKPAPKPTPKPTATATPKPTVHAAAQVVPSVTLPNQDVTFTGIGFPADTTVTVSVTIDMRGGGNRYVSKTAISDSNGNFTTAFRVPAKAAPGMYTVTGSASGAQASGRLQVLPRSAHPKNLNFKWVSLWYHSVRQGTWDYLAIQSTLTTQLGIWVHVIFPSGHHQDIYTTTDHNGHWAIRFTIPNHSASKHSNQAYVTFQLWHGKQTTQAFINFTLV